MSGHIPAHLARKVWKRAGNQCEYCHLSQEWQEATFHIDHVKPKALKGPTSLQNLALACVTCSLRKAARIKARDPKTGKIVRLFDPRTGDWRKHFRITHTFRILGRTNCGRATVRALGMNRSNIVAIRRELASITPNRRME
jgi:hypothetical protein